MALPSTAPASFVSAMVRNRPPPTIFKIWLRAMCAPPCHAPPTPEKTLGAGLAGVRLQALRKYDPDKKRLESYLMATAARIPCSACVLPSCSLMVQMTSVMLPADTGTNHHSAVPPG